MFGTGSAAASTEKLLAEVRDEVAAVHALVIEANRALVDVQRAGMESGVRIGNAVGEMLGVVVAHHAAVVEHQTQFAAMRRAASSNRVARSVNADRWREFVEASSDEARAAAGKRKLCRLVKEFVAAGDMDAGGVALADSLVPSEAEKNWREWPPLATPEIGSAPPHFPATVADLHSLSHTEILRLVAFYNEPMAMEPGDTLEERRDKFRRWVC